MRGTSSCRPCWRTPIRTLLIDGDIVAYEAAAASETRADFGDGELLQVENLEAGFKLFDQLVHRYMDRCEATEVVVALSCPTRRYWRHDLWPAYKAQRHGSPKPAGLEAIKTYCEKRWKTYRIPTLEADDVLGILQTSDRTVKGDKVLVSTDKDMKQLPGVLYNPMKGKITKITKTQADRWHMYQTLVGDTCDNYPGCPRIGPVKAERLLDESIKWSHVEAAFIRAGKTAEEALIQARIARILRAGEWDREKKEVKLWKPTTTL